MAKSLPELRKLQRNQLTRLTKEELIDSILTAPVQDEVPMQQLADKVNLLVNEINELKNVITSPDSVINVKISALQAQVDKQAEVIASQQRYLEILDRKERENNIIITGVPDENESLEGATTEEEKLNKIWSNVGVAVQEGTHRRLGNETRDGRRRPILVTINNKQVRLQVLENAKKLKQLTGEYTKIYIKKDIHPSIRKEWKRLRDAEKEERERPENAGCVIRFEAKERKLYRDGTIIDSWKQPYF